MTVQYKNLSEEDYLYKMFEIIDCMQLNSNNTTSPSEKELMILLLTLPEKYKHFMFSSISKREVMRKIAEKQGGKKPSSQSINNKIYSLIEKGLLWRDDDRIIYFKPYIKKAVEKLKEALAKGEHYDFVFRFKADEPKK
jgi:hypothetical protein